MHGAQWRGAIRVDEENGNDSRKLNKATAPKRELRGRLKSRSFRHRLQGEISHDTRSESTLKPSSANGIALPASGPVERATMFAEQIRQAAMASPRVELPKVSAALWKAYAAGTVTEADASELSDLIEARKAIPAPPKPVQRRVGSRPRTCASMERRRSWAAAGRMIAPNPRQRSADIRPSERSLSIAPLSAPSV